MHIQVLATMERLEQDGKVKYSATTIDPKAGLWFRFQPENGAKVPEGLCMVVGVLEEVSYERDGRTKRFLKVTGRAEARTLAKV